MSTRPPGIIVLGDGALIKEANLRQVLDKATLVYLKLSLASTYWKLRHQAIGSHPLLLQPPESTGELRPLLAERQGGFDQAHVTLDMDEMTPEVALRHCWISCPNGGQRGPYLRFALPGLQRYFFDRNRPCSITSGDFSC